MCVRTHLSRPRGADGVRCGELTCSKKDTEQQHKKKKEEEVRHV